MRKPQRAFTLVELLVVIGIIAILIGILVPVIGAVRKAAYAASSRNNIKTIANAIDSYQVTYQAYPGVYSNAQITTGVMPTNVTGGNLTMSENCLLSLAGGLTVSGGTYPNYTFAYTATDVGRGPLTFGATVKRAQGFVDATNKAMSTSGADLDPSVQWGTNVPEFIDAFPNAMPIIYLRAKVGAAGIADPSAGPADTLQYNPAQAAGYFKSPATFYTAISSSDFPANGSLSAGLQAYFGDGSLSTTTILVPKRKDTYILISPGEDRKYGTADDICNFSF